MPKQTAFNKDWLNLKDCNGNLLGHWLDECKDSKYKVICKLCNKIIKCDNRGVAQILSHAESGQHKKNTNVLVGMQLQLQASSDENTVQLFCKKDATVNAELLWGMKIACSNYSYKSSDGLKELLVKMFPDSKIAQDITIGSSKVSYLISDVLGPYFHQQLVQDINAASSPFTMQYDELSNAQTNKELSMYVRYWSDQKNEVNVHHLKSVLMGSATAKEVSTRILEAVQPDFQLKQMIALESDGPNVNKTVWNIITDKKIEMKYPGLIDIGSCSLHVVHNTFGKGIKVYGQDVVDLVINLHMFFKQSAVRCETFRNIQDELLVDQHKFLRHVENRWLTLHPAIKRILEQWPAILKYFLTDLPKKDPKISSNANYIRIANFLKPSAQNMTLVKFNFLNSVASLFTDFLLFFQREEPLIHLLDDYLRKVLLCLLRRFIKEQPLKCFWPDGIISLNLSDINNQMDSNDLEIGSETMKHMDKLLDRDKITAYNSIRSFFETTSKYLVSKLPPKNSVVYDCKCLQPKARTKSQSVTMIKSLANKLSLNIQLEALGDEWRLLQSEDIPASMYEEVKDDGTIKTKRIDHYWREIFAMKCPMSQLKFSTLALVVKTALILSHGNADVERGFSMSGRCVTSSRTPLSECSINSLLTTRDALKGQNLGEVIITKELLRMGRNAYTLYQTRMKEEKELVEKVRKEREEKQRNQQEEEKMQAKMKETVERKRKNIKDTISEEKMLTSEEQNVMNELDVGKTLIQDASDKIKRAIQVKDMKALQIGHLMLEAANKKVIDATKSLDSTRNKQKNLEKHKRNLLDYFSESVKNKKTKM